MLEHGSKHAMGVLGGPLGLLVFCGLGCGQGMSLVMGKLGGCQEGEEGAGSSTHTSLPAGGSADEK